MFDEEKKNEETTKAEEEVATEEIVEVEPEPEPEPEPVTEEPVEEAHHQKEELGKTDDLVIENVPEKKPWWKFW